MKEKYSTFESMVSEYANLKNQFIEQCENDLKANNQKAEDAAKKIEEALNNEDEKSYKHYREILDNTSYMNDFITIRMNECINGTKKDEEKAAEFLSEVRATYEDDIRLYIQKVSPIINELSEVNKAFLENADAANKVVMDWHQKIRPFMYVIGTVNGEEHKSPKLPRLLDHGVVASLERDIDTFKKGLADLEHKIEREINS